MALRQVDHFDPALGRRVLSSLVLVIGALVAILGGGWSFKLLLLVALVLMAWEWAGLGSADSPTGRAPTVAVCVAVPAIAMAVLLLAPSGSTALLVLLGGVLLAAGFGSLVPGMAPNRLAGGVLYLGLPCLSLLWLRGDTAAGLGHIVWLFLVVWATDIAAYFVGRSVGGPRLAPSISPGKTWSGLAGGMLGAGLVGGLQTLVAGAGFTLGAGLGVVLAVVAQVGDLFESGMKRRAGVKDSGHLIPGHGGLLDRIDGLLFAAPVFAGVVWLLGGGMQNP